MSLNLQQLAEALGLEFSGDAECEIAGVSSPGRAGPRDLCFLLQKKYLDEVQHSDCAAVILTPELASSVTGKALILSSNPQLSLARAIALLQLEPEAVAPGIHASAQIAPSAKLAGDVRVGANAVIDADCVVGEGSMIGAGSVLARGVEIGRDCLLHNRVTLGHSVRIGDRCILHPGSVIGADGFGLAFDEGHWHKIPQIGSVVIGDDVEIGANTTVDRGALDDTVIEQGCKLDNQIMVAHNVRIGAHTAIAGCAAIAGSSTIGRHCRISGGASIVGHLTIADHVTLTARSLVTKSIHKAGVYSSGTPLMENSEWHRVNVRYKSLDKLARRISKQDKSAGD